MIYRLGYGLPLSMTPERIKKVLGFARSQEREFQTALDRDAASAWAQTGPDDDLYQRLHSLLLTAYGREAFGKARHTFEKIKPKWSRRADFFGRLAEDCLQGALVQEEFTAILDDKPQSVANPQRHHGHCKEALARAKAWEKLAEYVWALSAGSKVGDGIIDLLNKHPEVAPFLEEVRAGLVSIDHPSEGSVEEPLPEEDGEAAKLVNDIREIIATLDVEHLEPEVLNGLHRAVRRLTAVAEARKGERRDTERLQLRFSAWRKLHSEALSNASELEDRLVLLNAQVDNDDVDPDRLETVLGRCEAILNIESRVREARASYERAYNQDDLDLVGSLSADLNSLKGERSKAYAAIDAELSEPLQEEEQQLGTPKTTEQPQDAKVDAAAVEDHDPDQRRPTPEQASEPAAEPPAADVPESIAGEDPSSDEVSAEKPPVTESPGENQVQPPVPDDGADIIVNRIERVVATAIERGRLGIAYHLALATPGTMPSANAIKLVASNYVTDERTSVAAELPDLAAKLTDEAKGALNEEPDQALRRSYAALMASAALTPARVAPGGPVAQLLLSLEAHLGDMPSLWALSKTAADVSMTGIHLPPELLYEDDSLERWTERTKILRKETDSWIEVERRAKLRFQPATRVWQRILDDWQDERRASIGHMFKLLAKPVDSIDIAGVKVVAERWRDNCEKEIDRIDRENRNAASSKKIDGSARFNLRSKIDEALAFADRWGALIEARPDKEPDYQTKQVNDLRAAVRDHAKAALTEITNLETPIAHKAKELVGCYITPFEDTATDAPALRMSLSDLLNGDLLADPNVHFDEMGSPSGEPLAPGLLLRLAKQDEADFKEAAVGAGEA